MARTLIPRADATPLVIKASHWEKYVGYFVPDHVRSGFTITDGGALVAAVAAGTAIVIGCECVADASENLNLTDNSTNHVFIDVARDGNSEPTSWAYTVNTTGTPPADSMKIAEVVTAAGAISQINMKRIFKVDDYVALFTKQSSNPTAPEDGNHSIFFVKEIDANNWQALIYLKKNGTFQFVSLG